MLLSLVAMWGSAFMLVSLALDTVSPVGIVAARLTLGAVVLVIIARATGRRLPRSPRMWAWAVLLALVGSAVPFFLISWGQQRIDSGVAGILMGIMPLAVMVMAHFLVPGERITRVRALGFASGFAGLVMLMGPAALAEIGGEGGRLVAQVAVLAAALCYAANAILARFRPPGDALVISAAVLVSAAAVTAPAAGLGIAADGFDLRSPGLVPVVALGLLGLFSTGVATVVYFRLIEAAGPGFLSLINYLIPGWAYLAGVLLLGERPGRSALAGLVLILLGVVLAQRPAAAVPAPPQRDSGGTTR